MAVQRLCGKYSLDLVFLVETKQQPCFINKMAAELGFVSICVVPPIGLSGGLAILGKEFHDIRVLSHD